MIVKFHTFYIEQVVDNLDAYIKYKHRSNLYRRERGMSIEEPDAELVALLGLEYQLKNIWLVEQTKQDQTRQQVQYLKERKDMLFGYLAVSPDSELENAIKSIQNDIAQLVKSMQNPSVIDVDIPDNLYKILAENNLLN